MSTDFRANVLSVSTSGDRVGSIEMKDHPHRLKYKNAGSVTIYLIGGPDFVAYGTATSYSWPLAAGETLDVLVPEGDTPPGGGAVEAGTIWAFVTSGTGTLLRLQEPQGTDH